MMISKEMWRLIISGLVLFSFSGCEKPPGEGGTSSVIGRVYAIDTNQDGVYQGEYWAPDKRVYIIYGDNEVFDDLTRTHFDGTYQFKFLHPGDYTLFAYSKCDSCAAGEEPIFQKIEITGRGQDVEVPTITIED